MLIQPCQDCIKPMSENIIKAPKPKPVNLGRLNKELTNDFGGSNFNLNSVSKLDNINNNKSKESNHHLAGSCMLTSG